MAYATRANVQDEIKGVVFSASTVPSDVAVDRFISEAESYINARLKNEYALPLTDPDAIAIVRSIEIGIVVGRAREIMRVQTGDTRLNQPGSSVKQDAIKMLDAIMNGDLVLPNSIPTKDATGVVSFGMDHCEERVFHKEREQW